MEKFHNTLTKNQEMANSCSLVSLVLICYNQEKYIREAMLGAFSQDYPNLEIVVSDDCSTDGTMTVIDECVASYSGNHSIVVNRNNTNLGLVRNLNKAISLSHGEYIVLAAGDDVSQPNRVSVSVEKIKEADVECLAVNFNYMDKDGNLLNMTGFDCQDSIKIFTIDNLGKGILPKSATAKIISRKLLDFFGPLNDDCQTEDTTLIVRAMLFGGMACYGVPCLNYRLHDESVSARHNLYTKIDPRKISRQYYKDICQAYASNIISRKVYRSAIKYIKDYRATQTLIRKLYVARSRMERRFHKLMYLINPCVHGKHRSLSYIKSISE